MPLSEDDEKILREIEEHLSATDPRLVQQVSDTTLYSHAVRVIKWAMLGFAAGLALLVLTFASMLALGVLGFLVMLGCLLVIERNVRKLGRAGLDTLSRSGSGSNAVKGVVDQARNRWRQRFGRDDPPR